MTQRSAGVLLYRRGEAGVEVLLAHPGGPYWQGKDAGAWQIPKGLIEEGEDAAAAARRETEEELGIALLGELRPLAQLRQAGGKRVEAFALEQDVDPAAIVSNRFELEWPPKSRTIQSFPEIDAARWMALDEARDMMLASQRPLLDALRLLLTEDDKGGVRPAAGPEPRDLAGLRTARSVRRPHSAPANRDRIAASKGVGSRQKASRRASAEAAYGSPRLVAKMNDIEKLLKSAREARTDGDIDTALDAYRHAAALARDGGHTTLLAHALRHVADIARETGAASTALEASREALAIYRDTPAVAPLDLANGLRVEALALQSLSRKSDAEPAWREARALYEAAGVLEGVAECDANLTPRSP